MQRYIYSKRNNTLTLKKNRSKSVALLVATTSILVLLAVFIQLYVMSLFATKGEEITALEEKKASLIRNNKELTEDIAKATNIEFIREKSKEVGYVDIKPSEVKYIKLED